MSGQETAPPTASGLKRSWWFRRLIAVLAAGSLAWAGWRAWHAWYVDVQGLPNFDLTNAHEDLVKAIRDAEAGVRANPRAAETWGQLGMVLLAHDYAPEASTCFLEADKRAQDDARWLYLDAQSCYKIYPLRAIELLEKAVVRDEQEPTFRMLLADLLMEQGRLDDAESHLKQTLHGESMRPWGQLRLAQIALRRGRVSAALDLALLAQGRLDHVKTVHVVLAEIYFRLGNTSAATHEQQMAHRLPPRSWPDPYMEVVEALKVSVLPRVAHAGHELAELEQVVQAHPQSGPARISLALAFANRRQWPAAARVAREALDINPNDAIALNVLGTALRNQGMLDDAIAAYQRSAQVNPHNAVTFYELANCYHQANQKPKVLEALQTALRLRPNYAHAWRELGQLHAHDNDLEAEKCFRRAVELAPDDPLAGKLLRDTQERLERAKRNAPM